MDATDPLLPPRDPTPWLASPSSGADPIDRALISVTNYFNLNAIALPAFDHSGRPVTPPAEHILDWLARAHDLVSEEEANTRPGAGTVAVIDQLPACDLCGAADARYDGKLTIDGRSTYGYSCYDCYATKGLGTLGASGDVYLITYFEVPSEVRSICEEITERNGRPSLWSPA